MNWHLNKILQIICLLCELNSIMCSMDQYRVIDTRLGQVRGVLRSSFLKKTAFYAFKGIPYAQPPVGNLRFKAPEPIGVWAPNILDAFNHSSSCMHADGSDSADGTDSEDCLYLNVYVPAKSGTKLAVMFSIHGGSYTGYSGNEYYSGPDFLIEQNVIVVTCNFRLGIFGFLSLNTSEYSGNMGLKDQQMALKWTYDNIERFGGSSNRITVIGDSSGSVSTHLQVLSNESRPYIHNAIMMSGTADALWAFSEQINHVSIAFEIASDLGYPNCTFDEMILLLNRTEPEKLANYKFSMVFLEKHKFIFAPVIERKDAIRPFITESPEQIYNTTQIKVDAIFYHTSMEMAFVGALYEKYIASYEPDTDLLIDLPFGLNLTTSSEVYMKLSKLVRQFYLGNGNLLITKDNFAKYVDLLSDANFVYPTQKTMKLHRKNARTYYIRFSVNSTLNFSKRQMGFTEKPGASHSDGTCYLFHSGICNKYYDEVMENRASKESVVSLRTIDYMTKLFTNFAKYDIMTNQPNVQGNNMNFLDITNDGLKLGVDPQKNAMDFWSRLENQAHRLTNDTIQN